MTALPRKSRLKFNDRRAVSEILANILILGITVVLFSTVIGFVSTVPEPDDPVRVEMSADLDGDILSIAHKGGSTLEKDPSVTSVRINADGTVRFFSLSDGSTTAGDPWDKDWSVGNTWVFNFTDNAEEFSEILEPGILYEPSTVDVSVTYINQGNVIWSATLKTDSNNPPRITNFRIEGQNSSGANIERLDTVKLSVTVKDSDSDMDTVIGNLNSLFKESVPTTTFDRVGPESWETTITPNADNGSKIISITATDLKGNTDREFYQVSIVAPDTLPTDDDDENDTPPPPTEDPTVPGGGDPEQSPSNFFEIDIQYDFFVYSAEDWESFETDIENGLPTPTLNETKSYNVGEEFYIVFKANHTTDGNNDFNIESKIEFFNPKRTSVDVENGGKVQPDQEIDYSGTLRVPEEGTTPEGYFTKYTVHKLEFTPEMADDGVLIKAYMRTGNPGGQKTIDWYGFSMVNPKPTPIVATFSSNETANTIYFKIENDIIKIIVFIDDAEEKYPLVSNPSIAEIELFTARQENNEPAGTINGDDVTLIKGTGGFFTIEIDKEKIEGNLSLSPGWTTVFVNVPQIYLAADSNDGFPWSPYRFAHKIYIEA